jgi:PAS domain S-box-containing protein
MLATCSVADLVQTLEAVGTPAFVLDLGTGAPRFLAANSRYAHLLSIDTEGLAGKRPGELLPDETAQRLEDGVRQAVEAGDQVEIDEQITLPSGTRQWRSALSPLRDAAGQVARILGTVAGAVHRPVAEIGLVASEAKFRGMFETAPIGVVLCAADGGFLDANDAYLDIIGRPRGDLDGKTIWSFVPPELSSVEGEQIAQLHASGRAGPVEVEYLRGDGTRVAVRVNAIGIGAGDGGERMIWAFVEDITQRKRADFQLRASERRMATILDTMVDALIAIDQNGRIEAFNKAAEAVFGYSAAEVIGRNVGMLMPEPMRDQHAEHMQRYLKSGEAHILGRRREVVARRKDGGVFALELGVSEITAEVLGGLERRRADRRSFVGLARDISDRKRFEAELMAAKGQAETANRAKSEFLANMSHELRTPLNAIIGFSEVIKDQLFGPVGNGRYAAYAHDIHAGGTHLLGVIDDILDMSRIETGRFTLEEGPVAPAELVSAALALVQRAAEQARVKLDNRVNGALPRLNADKRVAKQVLINLLSNAVKFTPEGGKVTVEAAADPAAEFVFTVTDTGPGIPPERLKNLFDPFQNADSMRAREQGGSGLGLAIAKRLMELHGGTLTLKSRLGHGTAAAMRFPGRRVMQGR